MKRHPREKHVREQIELYDPIKDIVDSKIFFQFFSDYTKYLASIPDSVNYSTKMVDNWFLITITERSGIDESLHAKSKTLAEH